MPLPTGIWKANVNGTEIDRSIDAPNQQSVFPGQFLGAEFKGFWDESTQSVAFTVTVIFEGSAAVTASFGEHLSGHRPIRNRDAM